MDEKDENGCLLMQKHCMEKAKVDPLNTWRWTAQAERWSELAKAQSAWRLQKRPPEHIPHVGPMAIQPQRQ